MKNTQYSRREALGTLGLGSAASLGFMMAQQNVAAQNVADKGANLKITDVRMFNVGKFYVRIQTNAGITSWCPVSLLPPKNQDSLFIGAVTIALT